MSVDSKGTFTMVTQCKSRAKPMHKIQATLASKKIKKSTQILGLSHGLCGESHSVQVNGNLSRNIHCSICNQAHMVMVTNCACCEYLKVKSYEYLLTTSDEHDRDSLRQWTSSNQCITQGGTSRKTYDTLYNAKFPLHIASCFWEGVQCRRQNGQQIIYILRHFCLRMGMTISIGLLSGYCGWLWTHWLHTQNKAKKYVYNKTVFDINLEEKNIDFSVIESALM